jgi:hypothetical protein
MCLIVAYNWVLMKMKNHDHSRMSIVHFLSKSKTMDIKIVLSDEFTLPGNLN